jgi:transcriptional regulator with XRE-family HTH domain
MPKTLELFAKAIEKRLDGRPHSWLADRSGVSRSKISRILSSQNEPTYLDMLAFAKAFEIEPIELLAEIEVDRAEALKKHKDKAQGHAEMRENMEDQIAETPATEKKLIDFINDVTTENIELEKKVEVLTETIKKHEKWIQNFDGSPEALQRLKNTIGKNIPLSESELFEMRLMSAQAKALADEGLGPARRREAPEPDPKKKKST